MVMAMLGRTTLEFAPFDGISRFRFKGSSGKSGVLSQRLPCVPVVNYELCPASTRRRLGEEVAGVTGVQELQNAILAATNGRADR